MELLDVVARFSIPPEKAQEFKQLASEALDVCRTQDSGTIAYEWFINEAQSECFVLETYAGAEGMLSHMKNAQLNVGQIMQFAAYAIEAFGNPPAQLAQALQGRVQFMPKFQGLPEPMRRSAEQPASTIRAVARFKIHPGKTDEFRRVAAECLQITTARDKGTLAYEWFANDAASEYTVLEAYRDAEALMEHSRNGGRHVGKLLKLSDVSVSMFANPNKEVLAMLKAMPVTLYERLQGLGN